MAVFTEKFTFKDLLKKCLPWRYAEDNLAAIKLYISLDKINNKKMITVKILQEVKKNF